MSYNRETMTPSEELRKRFAEQENISFDEIPINGVHLKYIEWLESQITGNRNIPYCCPVCNGVGKVNAGFYNMGMPGTSATPETCRSCSGAGIIYT